MAELTLTLNCAAAARRVAPDSTAAITRSRRSSEYAFVIPIPPNRGSQNPTSTIHCESLRDSIQAEFALAPEELPPPALVGCRSYCPVQFWPHAELALVQLLTHAARGSPKGGQFSVQRL